MKKIKLNYKSINYRVNPVSKVPISRCCMEKLDDAIRAKVKQNRIEQQASKDIAEEFIVF